jgi:hypothetical protein
MVVDTLDAPSPSIALFQNSKTRGAPSACCP